MEKNLQKEIETKFNQKIKDINEHIAEVDAALKELEDTLQELKPDNPDCDIFVAVKKGIHENIAKVEEKENHESTLSLKLHTDELVQQLIEGKRLFAELIDTFNIQKVEHIEDINMRLPNDKSSFGSGCICPLPDCNLIFPDIMNNKLKKLDIGSYAVTPLIDLPDMPHSVCLIDSNTLAVSLIMTKMVQFVSTLAPISVGNSFPVGDKCRGLAYCDDLLYVCCGGSDDEEPGHIEVYTRSGELQQKFYNDLSYPVRISVINDGHDTTMYISDFRKGVQVRGLDGVVKHTFSTAVDTGLPFDVIGKNQLLIGERSSQIVCMHTNNDRTLLLNKHVLKDEPYALYVDKKSSCLYVTYNKCDLIRVFKLKK